MKKSEIRIPKLKTIPKFCFVFRASSLKYSQIFKISWENGFVYRLNFVMWRVRSILRILMLYFLWSAVFSRSETVFGYEKSAMLTYILGTSILQALVLGSRSADVGGEISNGDVSNFLLKPVSYLRYWFVRDLADKLLNILFVVAELGLIFWILRPSLIFPQNGSTVLFFIIASLLAMFLFFYLSLLVSMTAFWYPEHGSWPPRFLFTVILEFIAGGIFPLDILPGLVFGLIKFLPTTYLLFFPLQIYLGRISGKEMFFGLIVMIAWTFILGKIVHFVWQKGLRRYEAYGR